MSNNASCAHDIIDHLVEVQFHRYCVYGYFEWYHIVSHPNIIPLIEHINDVGLSDVEGPSDDMPPLLLPSPGVDDHQRLQLMSILTNNLMGLINPNGEVYILASQITHIARDGPV